jgi:Single-strand binding protein family
MNRANITGRLTKDAEFRHLPSGEQVCDLRVAVDGAARERTPRRWAGAAPCAWKAKCHRCHHPTEFWKASDGGVALRRPLVGGAR